VEHFFDDLSGERISVTSAEAGMILWFGETEKKDGYSTQRKLDFEFFYVRTVRTTVQPYDGVSFTLLRWLDPRGLPTLQTNQHASS